MPSKPHWVRLRWRKFSWGHLWKQMALSLPFFLTCKPVRNCLSICHYFLIITFFNVCWVGAWSAVCLWWNAYFTEQYKTRAMAATTKITYSERTQWSDTSISSPAGDRENRGGHYKVHVAGKVRSIFYPTLTSPIPQTRPFSPGSLPFSAPLKMEACFPSINCCTRSFAFEGCYIMWLFPFQHVLGRKFVHFVLESEDANTQVVQSLLSNHWQMCNGFPVVLLP